MTKDQSHDRYIKFMESFLPALLAQKEVTIKIDYDEVVSVYGANGGEQLELGMLLSCCDDNLLPF